MKYFIYETMSGDTFDILALDAYNNEFKASEIIKINPEHANKIIFPAGVKLKIPFLDEKEVDETLPPWRR